MSSIVDVPVDVPATARTRARYNRNAPFYDLMTRGSERRLASARAAMWKAARGPRVLEVGVGTGINMPYYPPGMQMTAIDLSPRMLERARLRAQKLDVVVDLREADAQALPFPDGSFETVVGTCVFCSVPDPELGLRELRRVLVPGGQLLLMEHVLSQRPLVRKLMQWLNPMVVWMMGANINRDTVANVETAGFQNLEVQNLWLHIFKAVEARAPERQSTGADGKGSTMPPVRLSKTTLSGGVREPQFGDSAR
jgi:ubiquinone/menaquinone biosynthesis C-methylase UbiE